MGIDIFKVMSVVNPIVGISLFNLYKNNKEQRTKATTGFKKILDKKELFEECLTDLVTLEDDVSDNLRQKTFSKAYTKYTALYNEIEEFCGEVLDGAIKSKKYIKGSVYNSLCQYAKLQVNFYTQLKQYSETHKLAPIRKIGIGSFINYDKFLIKYSGGEQSQLWLEILNLRRDSDFN